MSFSDVASSGNRNDDATGPLSERLSLGVAARLSRYLQVLTPGPQDGQGDDLLPGALRVHARQLDADPPRPVGLRQVRQARRRLQRRLAGLADPQDPAHRRGQHNIALFGAGHLGRAIASSDIFADHGFRVVAMFDADRDQDRRADQRRRASATSTTSSRSSRRRTSSSASSPSRRPPRRSWPTSSSTPASRSSSTTPRRCCRCRRR